MIEKLDISCLNTGGVGDKGKRKAVMSWLEDKGCGIILLEETHSALENWNGIVKFSHGSTNSKGVAILISFQLDIVISDIVKDNNGRFLLLDCTISESRYIIVNI